MQPACIVPLLGTFITRRHGTRIIQSGDVPFASNLSSEGKGYSDKLNISVPDPELVALSSFYVLSWQCHSRFQHVKFTGSVTVTTDNKTYRILRLFNNKYASLK